jgi:hypothetical protein
MMDVSSTPRYCQSQRLRAIGSIAISPCSLQSRFTSGGRAILKSTGRTGVSINLDELEEYEKQGRLTKSAFRLECLDQYLVDSDQENVTQYLNGGDKPSWADGDDWMEYLAEEKASGIRRFRVHVLRTPLNPYLRYECEWGYVYTSQAGEEIYILDTAETPRPVNIRR